jgi:CheY-like chemotaxis protein
VVEDNLDNQQVVVSMLRKLGWQSELACDGLVALDLVRRNEYAAVLMDCQIPEMDGYMATEAIRAWERVHRIHAAVPIVALTANAMNGDRERCLRAGMNDYISKPFRMHELQSALERWANCDGIALPGTMLA